jgi:hypothetical protein
MKTYTALGRDVANVGLCAVLRQRVRAGELSCRGVGRSKGWVSQMSFTEVLFRLGTRNKHGICASHVSTNTVR